MKIQIPEFVAWDFDISSGVLSSIRSKSKRKIVKKSQELLTENEILVQYQAIESREKFVFLLNAFRELQVEKGNNFVLNENWFDLNTQRNRNLESLELWQNSTLVGLKMYSYDKEGFFLSHKATKRELDKKIDLGLVLDSLSFRRAYDLGYLKVNCGKGKNLFGIQVQLSLYEYKVSMGMSIRIAKDSKLHDIVPSSTEQNNFIVYCFLDGQESLLWVHSDDIIPSEKEVQRLSPVNMKLEIMKNEDFHALFTQNT